jgi:alpha-mannosidase
LRWAAAEGDRGGLALLNEGKHAVRLEEDGLMLPLLRTPPFVEQGRWVIHRQPPDVPEFNDLGPFEVRFALLPYRGSWREAGIARQAMGFNAPLRAWLTESHCGILPSEFSLVSLEPESAMLSALKPAEGGDGLILRIYEAHGRPTQAILRFASAVSRIIETDLLEEPVGLIAEDARELSLSLKAHQIRTLQLELGYGGDRQEN